MGELLVPLMRIRALSFWTRLASYPIHFRPSFSKFFEAVKFSPPRNRKRDL